MSQVALGLDLGTSGVRVLAVNANGEVIAEVNKHYPLLTPQPGWTEQNPSDWVRESVAALKEMAERLSEHEIVALGLSGQMHGMVPLDAQTRVVRPALLWNDQRTESAVSEMEQRVPRSDMILRTGNPAITGFHVCKLIWMRQQEPDNFAKTKHSLLPKDYLGFVLTGTMASEPSDNSGTNCFHLASKTWDEEVLSALDLSPSLFPDVLASHEQTGTLTTDMAKATSLPANLPVIAGAGDNAAAATGLGLSSKNLGLGSVSLGTSGVIFAPLKEATPDPDGRVHLFCHADGGYNLLGVTLSAAGSLQWYHDTLASDQAFTELIEKAESSPIGANGVSFKPYLAGERTPHMNPNLRGSLTGLSLATNQADITRSVLEGVAFSLKDAQNVISPLSPLSSALATGGGAQSQFWLQMVSDVLALPLSIPSFNQGAAYGAALLALKGTKIIKDTLELSTSKATTEVRPNNSSAYEQAFERYQSIKL